jgi:hypothetical protein
VVYAYARGQAAAALKVVTDNKKAIDQAALLEDKKLGDAMLTHHTFSQAFGDGRNALLKPAEVIVKAALSSCNESAQ